MRLCLSFTCLLQCAAAIGNSFEILSTTTKLNDRVQMLGLSRAVQVDGGQHRIDGGGGGDINVKC